MRDFSVDQDSQSVWFEPDYPADVRQFFTETAAVELISCLDDQPKRFDDLREQLGFSKATINQRLTEARGLGLVRVGQARREEKIYRVHSLTPMGDVVSQRMQEIGLTQTHQRLWTIRLEFEQYKTTFEEWVDDSDGLEANIEEFVDMLEPDE